MPLLRCLLTYCTLRYNDDFVVRGPTKRRREVELRHEREWSRDFVFCGSFLP